MLTVVLQPALKLRHQCQQQRQQQQQLSHLDLYVMMDGLSISLNAIVSLMIVASGLMLKMCVRVMVEIWPLFLMLTLQALQ